MYMAVLVGMELEFRGDLQHGINADYQQNGIGECLYQLLEAWLKRNHNKARLGPPAIAVKRSGKTEVVGKFRLNTKIRVL